MYKDVVKKLIEKNLTISTAESITGGLISKMITDVPGSSKILAESYVTYSNEAKVRILGVDKDTIEKCGVVSKEVAMEMAVRLGMITGSRICISTTGNAGPDICDNKPVGRVYVGIAYRKENVDKNKISDYRVNIVECNFSTDYDGSVESNFINRDKVRVDTANTVFAELDKLLGGI